MKKFMTRTNDNVNMEEFKKNFNPIDFSQQQPIEMTIQHNPTEYMMNNMIVVEPSDDTMVDNKIVRDNLINRTYVLDKIKQLYLLDKLNYCTPKMCAEYFEVDYNTIKSCIKRNIDELIENGLVRKTGKELKEIINNVGYNMHLISNRTEFIYDEQSFRNNTNILLTKRTVFNIAMLLRDSVVAKEVRKAILDNLEEIDYVLPNKLNKVYNMIDKTPKSKEELQKIEDDIQLRKQQIANLSDHDKIDLLFKMVHNIYFDTNTKW